MKTFTSLLTIFLFSLFSNAQIQVPSLLFEYSHNVDIKQTTTDLNGNLILCGGFNNTKDIDISSNTLMMTSTDNGFGTKTEDGYLAKYGSSGNLLWKVILSTTIDDYFHIAKTDINGNIYVYGYTTNSANINPLGAPFYLPSTGNFIAKYTTQGILVWAFRTDINMPDLTFNTFYKEFIKIDQTNQYFYVAGFINDSVDVDPSIGNTHMLYDTTISALRKTFVLVKYDLNGNYINSADFEGATDVNTGGGTSLGFTAFKTDNTGNLWIIGSIYQYINDIDPSSAVNNIVGVGGSNTSWIAKFDSNFQFQFANTLLGCNFFSMDFNSQNNIVLAGDFVGTVDFNFGAGNNSLAAGPSTGDFFIAKYDQNLNYISAFTHGNTPTTFSRFHSIFIDSNNNSIVLGTYNLSSVVSDFDPSVGGTYTVTGNGSFLAKYSPLDSLISMGIINQLNGFDNYMNFNKTNNKIDYFGGYTANQNFDFDLTAQGVFLENHPTAMNFIARYNLNCENAVNDTIYQTICYTDTFQIANQKFYTSGIFPIIYQATNGCDSIIKLNLNVIPNQIAVSHTICSSQSYNFNGTVLNNSGLYKDTLLNILGCDSIINLTLTVVTLDTTVTFSNNVLTSAENFINFQWINCTNNSNINYANNNTLSVNSASDYAVILSKQGCVDTTRCIHINFTDPSSIQPSNLWGNQLSNLTVKAFTTDKNGNSFLIGYQLPVIDLDPGPANYSPPNIINGLYILKYNINGSLMWAKWIEPMPSETGTFTVTNATTDSSGAVIISGGFVGDFDVDASTTVNEVISNASNSPNSDMFMMKYDRNGSFAWFNSFGDGLKNYFTDVVIDNNNNINCVGYVQDYLDFDPGTNVANLDTYNGFIAKYSANGNYISGIGMDDNVTVNQIATDNLNNILVSGDFIQSRDIAPGIANNYTIGDSYMGVSSSYISKIDANYNIITGIGILSDNIIKVTDIATDKNGNLNVIGTLNSANNNFNYNGGLVSITPHLGGGDGFLVQYNQNLELNWYRKIANSFVEYPKQILIDSISNIFVFGGYKMDLDVDGTNGTLNLTGDFSTTDTYLTSYNMNGYFNWGTKIGSVSNDDCVGFSIDKNANIYCCVNASNTVVYNKGSNNNSNLNTNSGPGAHFARYGYCSSIDNSVSQFGNYLMANAQNATYQWYDCNTTMPINGETNATFYPTMSGSYYVNISNGNCALSSNCINFVATSAYLSNSIHEIFEIYPNPNQGILKIKYLSNNENKNNELFIYDALGQIYYNKKEVYNYDEINISELKNGIYFICIQSNSRKLVKKLIKN